MSWSLGEGVEVGDGARVINGDGTEGPCVPFLRSLKKERVHLGAVSQELC